jgi:hypothetical protein
MKLAASLVLGIGIVAGMASAPALAEEPTTVEAALQARHSESWPLVGLMADVGLPDGAIGSLVVRPWQWLRFYGGGGTNSVSRGFRGGLSLLPFGAGPSLTVEYGHYGEGNANGVVKRVMNQWNGSPLLDRVGYDYANAHVGLDFGGKRVIFFVHGGISRVWAEVHNLNAALGDSNSGTVIRVGQDPKVQVTGSSLKVGLIVFLI